MKKIFLLLAIALFAVNGQAQNTYTKSSMVLFVAEAKKTFVKGTKYTDWVKTQVGTATPTIQETNLLKDIYGFVSTNQNSESVFKNYDGVSLLNLARTKGGVVALSESNNRGFLNWIIRVIIWYEMEFGMLNDI